MSVGMEAELLIKAVRINTLSKLTFSDTSCFLSLIGDIFPGAESSDVAGGELEVAREICRGHCQSGVVTFLILVNVDTALSFYFALHGYMPSYKSDAHTSLRVGVSSTSSQ